MLIFLKKLSAQIGQPSAFSTLELYQTRKESHCPSKAIGPFVDSWRAGWQLVLVIEVKFSIFAEQSGGLE